MYLTVKEFKSIDEEEPKQYENILLKVKNEDDQIDFVIGYKTHLGNYTNQNNPIQCYNKNQIMGYAKLVKISNILIKKHKYPTWYSKYPLVSFDILEQNEEELMSL